jgi:hypothetical protein
MGVVGSNILAGSSGAAEAYTIDQSLRFNGADNSELTRSPGTPTSTQIGTVSVWTKSDVGINADWAGIISNYSDNDNRIYLAIGNDTLANQYLIVYGKVGGSANVYLRSDMRIRDPAAWYHLVMAYDTTQVTAANRIRLYVNNVELTDFSIETYPDQNAIMRFNGEPNLQVGRRYAGGSLGTYGGYLAEFNFIDGQQLTPSSFGETDTATNQWKPIEATGLTYGTNGFYQKYGGTPLTVDAFTSTGADTWTCPAGVTEIELLVVAGGGGGAHRYYGGGGGAGGIIYDTSYTVVPGVVYDLSVGGGGAAGASAGEAADGGDTVWNVNAEGSGITFTADGGGGGSGTGNGNPGGSGGGAKGSEGSSYTGGAATQASPTGATGYGYAGGNEIDWGGAGGGGSSEVGGSPDTPTGKGGDGGDGRLFSTFIAYGTDSSNVASTGSNGGYFGGGGGGGAYPDSASAIGGVGGIGGGGKGAKDEGGASNAVAGTANTGGGGGAGAWGESGTANGKAGGSGVILISYGISLGTDSSGNDNNFTVTNLVATDQMVDSPTNNFATWNAVLPLASSATLSEGNLEFDNASGAHRMVFSTIPFQSGKWYAEILCKDRGGEWPALGVSSTGASQYYPESYMGEGTRQYAYLADGRKEVDQAWSTYGNTWTDGDIIGIAIDFDNRYIYYSKNGTWQDSGDPTSGGSGTGAGGAINADVDELVFAMSCIQSGTTEYVLNHGSDSSFAGNLTAQGNQDSNSIGDFYYEPPTDFLALCSSNLASPEIALPTAHFNTKLYTGDGATTLAVTGVGFSPGMTWIKNRDQADDHTLVDSVRGATKYLVPNETDAEVDDSTFVASLDSDGFTVGDDVVVNTSTEDYASWNWKAGGTAASNTDGTITSSVSANPTAGFSIVSWTGQASVPTSTTVGHGLAQAPELIIVRNRPDVEQWVVYNATVGDTKHLRLNTGDSEVTETAIWNNTTPSASVFTVGDSGAANGASDAMIAYCFHSVEGYSKVGSYEGNGDTDGAFVYTGFRPAFVMYKCYNQAEDWYMLDNKRDTYNVVDKSLIADSNAAEVSTTASDTDFVSNGFKLRTSTSGNYSGYYWVYVAFAESPFKYSNAR